MQKLDPRLALIPALAILLAGSCILVVDPEEYRSDPPAGGGTTTNTTGPSGASGGGGSGGAPVVCEADLQSDESNCGSCGFVCDTEPCVAGVCGGSVTLDGGALISVAVADGLLFFVQRDLDNGNADGGAVANALDRGAIRTLPLDLDKAELGLGHPVENVVSTLAVGTVGAKHVYFSGQNDGGALQMTLQACDARECVDLYPDFLPVVQVQSLVPVGPTLYIGLSYSTVVSLAIHPITGIPSVTETTEVSSCEPPMPSPPDGLGLHHLAYAAAPEPALLFSSFDPLIDNTPTGAIYRAPIAELPLLGGGDSATQWGGNYTVDGFLPAPDGAVFVHDAYTTQLLRVAGTPPTTTVFDEDSGAQRAVDESFVYLSSTGTPQVVRALALDGSGEVAQSPAGPLDSPPIRAIDARHPDYVFYARGNSIHRWPKPRR
jgi:hypothetical protein